MAGHDGSFGPVVARYTGLEPRPGRIFLIEVVHSQCSKRFKGMECKSAVYGNVHYKEPLPEEIR